jgi:hypothetical protein
MIQSLINLGIVDQCTRGKERGIAREVEGNSGRGRDEQYKRKRKKAREVKGNNERG